MQLFVVAMATVIAEGAICLPLTREVDFAKQKTEGEMCANALVICN